MAWRYTDKKLGGGWRTENKRKGTGSRAEIEKNTLETERGRE